MAQSPEDKKADDFLDAANEGCFSCSNFGKSTCPAFKKAVEDLGVNPQLLQVKIQKLQEGQEMRACENDTGTDDGFGASNDNDDLEL